HKVCRIIRTGTAPDKTDEHADNDGGQNRDEFAEHKSTLQQPEKRVAHISRQTGVRFYCMYRCLGAIHASHCHPFSLSSKLRHSDAELPQTRRLIPLATPFQPPSAGAKVS